MKKRNILWAAVALLSVACTQEETVGPGTAGTADKQVQMTFTANAPAGAADTRTSLQQQGQVYWEHGDVIGVYSCIPDNGYFFACQGNPFITDLTAPSPTATFTGTATEGAEKYFAVYPCEQFIGCMWRVMEGKEMTTLSFLLPVEQQAVAGGFASGLAPSWAATDDLDGGLNFKNFCALVKFSISDGDIDNLKSVRLTDLGKAGLSGGCNYNEVGGMSSYIANESIVTLAGSFTAGEDYYFVVFPTDFDSPPALQNGFSLTFTKNDGTTFVKTSTAGIGTGQTLAAGTILDLGEIDLSGATFEGRITNTELIAAIGDQVEWTTEEDGTVRLTGENLQAIEATTSLDVNGTSKVFGDKLTSLLGIEYFTNLTSLDCSDNILVSLDVKELTSLASLDCSGNELVSLDVKELTNLTSLDCSGNVLFSLDVSTLTSLTTLNCSSSALLSLDVSKLTSLTTLNCSQNVITALDITQLTSLTELRCGNQQDLMENDQTLTLTLTSTQKGTWESTWKDYPENGSSVTLVEQ